MIVALVIGLILTFTAVMPLVSDYAEAKTFTNEDGLIKASPINADTNVSLVWDYTAPSKITVGDTAVDIPAGAYPITFAFSETWMVRIQPGSNGSVQVYDSENVTATVSAGVSTTTSLNVALTGDSVTFTVGETTKTYPVNGGLVIDPNGSYILKKSTDSSYFSESSTAYIAGYSYHALGNTGAVVGMFTYSLNDGIVALSTYPPTFTFTDTVNKTDVAGYESLTKLTSIVLDASDGVNTGTITYNQFFVPEKVTDEPDNPAVYKNLVKVLPLFALILLVAGAASLVYFKNKD